jgi:predicted transcriptional regulator of viral defense system
MPGSAFETVMDVAAEQYGYVTTLQARNRGVTANALRMMATRGALERVARGVYRIPTFPPSPYAEYMEASLWPAGGVRGVISHGSALALRGLSDISPSQVHLTVPQSFRVRREVPSHLVVHHAQLPDAAITMFEAIPVTTVKRTIEDCHRAHIGPALLRQALTDAEREGFLTPSAVADLAAQVLQQTKVVP